MYLLSVAPQTSLGVIPASAATSRKVMLGRDGEPRVDCEACEAAAPDNPCQPGDVQDGKGLGEEVPPFHSVARGLTPVSKLRFLARSCRSVSLAGSFWKTATASVAFSRLPNRV